MEFVSSICATCLVLPVDLACCFILVRCWPFWCIFSASVLVGRLFTVKCLGNCESSGTLSGRVVSIQFSSVGKNGSLFSGNFSSYNSHLCINSGHFLSQAACMLALHDAQCLL